MDAVYHQEKLARSALGLSVAALLAAVFRAGIFPYIFGVLGLLFALLSRGRDRGYKPAARRALVIAAGALILNTAFLAYSYYNIYKILQDPVQRELLSQQVYEQTGLTLDDMLSQFRSFFR